MDAPRRDMELLSNSLAAYAHIRANPESFGLYFVLGVCFGLLLTLCLLVISISCAPRPRPRGPAPRRDPRSSTLEAEDDDDDDDDEDTVTRLGPDDTLPGPELSAEPDGPLSVNVFTSAEELERAQRLEERERILREIWRTGQPHGHRHPEPNALLLTGPAPAARRSAYWTCIGAPNCPRTFELLLPTVLWRPRPHGSPRCYWARILIPSETPFPSPARRPGAGGGSVGRRAPTPLSGVNR
uniref:EVA1 domain-containing protein n=1 Tax=Sus scrofa TaxID=9823 RepID=A0A8D1TMN0_PIG